MSNKVRPRMPGYDLSFASRPTTKQGFTEFYADEVEDIIGLKHLLVAKLGEEVATNILLAFWTGGSDQTIGSIVNRTWKTRKRNLQLRPAAIPAITLSRFFAWYETAPPLPSLDERADRPKPKPKPVTPLAPAGTVMLSVEDAKDHVASLEDAIQRTRQQREIVEVQLDAVKGQLEFIDQTIEGLLQSLDSVACHTIGRR